jgi:hypothetical protein
VQVAENVKFRANLTFPFPKPIVFCADERYRRHICTKFSPISGSMYGRNLPKPNAFNRFITV